MSWFSKFAGSIVGGALGFLGGERANKQQASQFAQNYQLAHDQLYKQHQIEVEDLKAAGLNPILSANGGNSTFGASSGGTYENLGTAATSGYMVAQQAKNLQMQNEAIKATVEKTRAEASNVLQDTKLKSAQTSQVQGETTLIPLKADNISAHCRECASLQPIHLPQGIVQGSAPRSGGEAGEPNTMRKPDFVPLSGTRQQSIG